jgi:hypothetical protein
VIEYDGNGVECDGIKSEVKRGKEEKEEQEGY